jgi:glycosyltransferase involved in cell wall biosynthesis
MGVKKCLLVSVRADYGGGPEHILSLLNGLATRREFVVAAPLGQAYSRRFGEYAVLQDLAYRRFSLRSFIRLIVLVRREKIGIIHSHGKGAGIYGRLLGWVTGCPVVHTFHGFHYAHLPPLKRYLYLAIERLLARKTAVLLNVSASEQVSCTEADVLKSAKNVVVPNGVAVPFSKRAASSHVDGRPWKLINVARHEREKGVDGVLRIARKLSECGFNYELWLVGDGEQSGELKKQVLADGLTGKVHFLGFRNDVAALLQSADIFVSASHGEGMPLTLLEAMAAGLPTVASDVVGNRDVVDHEQTGFLFPLLEPELGADAVVRLAQDARLYELCSKAAHQRALDRYSVEVMCERINAVYEEVTANTLMGRN